MLDPLPNLRLDNVDQSVVSVKSGCFLFRSRVCAALLQQNFDCNLDRRSHYSSECKKILRAEPQIDRRGRVFTLMLHLNYWCSFLTALPLATEILETTNLGVDHKRESRVLIPPVIARRWHPRRASGSSCPPNISLQYGFVLSIRRPTSRTFPLHFSCLPRSLG